MFRVGNQIDSYTLIEELGRGSFGVVWLAEEHSRIGAGPRVALKIALDDRMDMAGIEREAKIWIAASGHINVVPIWRVLVSDDQVVIVSEFIEEGSLEKWLTRSSENSSSMVRAVEITSGILAGLAHLHSRGVLRISTREAYYIET